MTKTYELLLPLSDRPGRYASEDPRLIPGDHVKVGFRVDPMPDAPRGEWMWLAVTAVEGDWPHATYRGELCNRPFLIEPAKLRLGQPVEFGAGHIYSVVRDSPDRPQDKRETPP